MYCEMSKEIKFDETALIEYLSEIKSKIEFPLTEVSIIDIINFDGGNAFKRPGNQKNWHTWVNSKEIARSRPGWAIIDREIGRTIIDLQKCKELEIYHHSIFEKPTSALFGYMNEVIGKLSEKGIQLTHTWLAYFAPGKGYTRHYHSTNEDYFRVLHIPILTDEATKMRFFSDHDINGLSPIETFHMQAGHCYMIDGSVVHDAINTSNQPRWHFCSVAYDFENNFAMGRGGREAFENQRQQAKDWEHFVKTGNGPKFLDWK